MMDEPFVSVPISIDDQIVNSKSDLANMVRILTMQRDQASAEVQRLTACLHDYENTYPEAKGSLRTRITELEGRLVACSEGHMRDKSTLRARITELEGALELAREFMSDEAQEGFDEACTALAQEKS